MKNKKSQDPTEAALSAIEDALNIGTEAPEVAPPASDRRGEPRVREPANDVFAQRSRRTRPCAASMASATSSSASGDSDVSSDTALFRYAGWGAASGEESRAGVS